MRISISLHFCELRRQGQSRTKPLALQRFLRYFPGRSELAAAAFGEGEIEECNSASARYFGGLRKASFLPDMISALAPVELWVTFPDITFDIHGNRILGDVEDRILSLPWDDFKSLKNVIAVACGLDKKNAIRGALRTGLINRLIVDDQTALAVLQETENAILKLPHSNEAKA